MLEGLARDVPEGDVGPGDHLHPRALATVVGEEAVHLLPEPLPLQRVLADQRPPQPLEADRAAGGRIDDRLADVRLRLDVRPAGDPLVGGDLQQRDEAHAVRLPGRGRIG